MKICGERLRALRESMHLSQMKIAKMFGIEQLVNRGMIADLAIHEPDKSEIPNPHFHVLCPIRPLNADGTWGMKQHRVYILDEHGNRIPDGDGDYLFKAVPTTDWGRLSM